MKNISDQSGQVLIIVLAVLSIVTTISLGLASQIISTRQNSKLMEISTKVKADSQTSAEKALIGDLTNLPFGVTIDVSDNVTEIGLEKELILDNHSTFYLKEYDVESGVFGSGISVPPYLCLSSEIGIVEISLISGVAGNYERKFHVYDENANSPAAIPGASSFDSDNSNCPSHLPKRITVPISSTSLLLTVRVVTSASPEINPKVRLVFGDEISIPQGRMITTSKTSSGITQSEVVFQNHPQFLPMLLLTRF